LTNVIEDILLYVDKTVESQTDKAMYNSSQPGKVDEHSRKNGDVEHRFLTIEDRDSAPLWGSVFGIFISFFLLAIFTVLTGGLGLLWLR
jgi:hypothetical protein